MLHAMQERKLDSLSDAWATT